MDVLPLPAPERAMALRQLCAVRPCIEVFVCLRPCLPLSMPAPTDITHPLGNYTQVSWFALSPTGFVFVLHSLDTFNAAAG